MKQQATLINYNGKEITLSELSIITSINYNTLRSRYLAGNRGIDLIRKPDKTKRTKETKRKPEIYDKLNNSKSLVQLSKETGISYATLWRRYLWGWRGSNLIKPPSKNDRYNKSRAVIKSYSYN